MKTTYSVNCSTRLESNSFFTSEIEAEARRVFEEEKQKLLKEEPADTTGWTDNDRAWSDVYTVELLKITLNDADDVEDLETLDETNAYYR